jgi:carboxyl-terminal processing protease
MKSVIFDLRDNPGGLYNIVCEILDDLLPEGTVVYTMDKDGNKEAQTSDANFLDMPMVVLQNENSASASEIFAGAIQDFGAGKIVGTQSFGKGIVQSIIPLSDGSAVKLTVEKYYTPKGVNIHGTGITPDVVVEAGDDENTDEQLQKAIEVIKSEK